jgi:hypothetical protein
MKLAPSFPCGEAIMMANEEMSCCGNLDLRPLDICGESDISLQASRVNQLSIHSLLLLIDSFASSSAAGQSFL